MPCCVAATSPAYIQILLQAIPSVSPWVSCHTAMLTNRQNAKERKKSVTEAEAGWEEVDTTGRLNSNSWWQRNGMCFRTFSWMCLSMYNVIPVLTWMCSVTTATASTLWFTAFDVFFLRSHRRGMHCWWKARPCLSHRVSHKLQHAPPLHAVLPWSLIKLPVLPCFYCSRLRKPCPSSPNSPSSLLFFPW